MEQSCYLDGHQIRFFERDLPCIALNIVVQIKQVWEIWIFGTRALVSGVAEPKKALAKIALVCKCELRIVERVLADLDCIIEPGPLSVCAKGNHMQAQTYQLPFTV
jgi:hypothetical protein